MPGEEGWRWAATEAGPSGVVGIIVGVILGFPRVDLAQEQISGTSVSVTTIKTFHNAFTHGDLSSVVDAGIFFGAVIAVAFGVIGQWLFVQFRYRETP